MYFEISRKSSIERYIPYLLISVFTPLIIGDYLMGQYLITAQAGYYITLNVVVFICFISTLYLMINMYIKYTEITKNPAVRWLHTMNMLEFKDLTTLKIIHIDDIVFIEVYDKRVGNKVLIHTDYETAKFYFTDKGEDDWNDFIQNYISEFDIPVDYVKGGILGWLR